MIKQLLTSGSILTLVLLGIPAQAQTQNPAPPAQTSPQTPVSPTELQKFAKSVKQILVIEQGAMTEKVQAIKAEGLSEGRFIEIYRVQQSQAQPQTAVTPQEKQKYDKVFTKLGEIEKKTQLQMIQVLKKEGLEVPRFNQILAAVRENPSLREQVEQMLKS